MALVGYAAWLARRGSRAPLFFLIWFFIVLGPVLPLRDHISDYYLTLPSIGVAWLGAAAVAYAFSRHGRKMWLWRATAAAMAAFFLVVSVPQVLRVTQWWHARAKRVRNMTLGVAEARQLHPHQAILLTGVDDGLFWGGIMDGCFRAVGVSDVYLEPGTEKRIQHLPSLGDPSRFILAPQAVLHALVEHKVQVYQVGDRLVNITRSYAKTMGKHLENSPQYTANAGNPLDAHLFGDSWYGIEDGWRWMPRRATLRLRGPDAPGKKLRIQGFCPRRQVLAGPLSLFVTVDGVRLAPLKITSGDAQFTFDCPLPASAVGKAEMEITLESERVFLSESDNRELSLVFGTFEIH